MKNFLSSKKAKIVFISVLVLLIILVFVFVVMRRRLTDSKFNSELKFESELGLIEESGKVPEIVKEIQDFVKKDEKVDEDKDKNNVDLNLDKKYEIKNENIDKGENKTNVPKMTIDAKCNNGVCVDFDYSYQGLRKNVGNVSLLSEKDKSLLEIEFSSQEENLLVSELYLDANVSNAAQIVEKFSKLTAKDLDENDLPSKAFAIAEYCNLPNSSKDVLKNLIYNRVSKGAYDKYSSSVVVAVARASLYCAKPNLIETQKVQSYNNYLLRTLLNK